MTATSWWMLFLRIKYVKLRIKIIILLVIRRMRLKARLKNIIPEKKDKYLSGNSVTGSLASWVTSSNR